MPDFDWERLSAEVGEAECRRLRPWLVAQYYVFAVWRRVRIVFLAAMAYVLLTVFWRMGTAEPREWAKDEEWPLIGQAAFVLFWGLWLVARLLNAVVERRLTRARRAVAAGRAAAAEPASFATQSVAAEFPVEGPAAEESPEEQYAQAIEEFDEQWRWVRDRVGEKEWRRLITLRTAWLWLSRVRTYALLITAFYVLLVVFDVLGQRKSLAAALAWHPIQLAPFIAFLSQGGVWMVIQVVRQRLNALGWQGHNPEALDRAIWAEHASRTLRQEQSRLAEQAADGRAQETARQRFEEDSRTAPAWWKRELTGAHGVWWASFAAFVLLDVYAHTTTPDAVVAMLLFLWLTGVIVKITILLFYLLLLAAPDSRRRATRAYRWLARGWQPVALALLPGLLGYLAATMWP